MYLLISSSELSLLRLVWLVGGDSGLYFRSPDCKPPPQHDWVLIGTYY